MKWIISSSRVFTLVIAAQLILAGNFTAGAATQQEAIATFANDGKITWVTQATCGWYTIEWAPQATGAWRAAWREQARIAATTGVQSAEIPRFFRLAYSPQCRQEDEVAAEGDGLHQVLSGRLSHIAIVPSSSVFRLSIYLLTDAQGDGHLSGTAASTGYVSYETGQFSVVLPSQAETGVPLLATYDYVCTANTNCVRTEILFTGNGSFTSFQGTLGSPPIQPGSASITAGNWYFEDDDGDGNLAGPGGAGGTLDYQTGSFTLTFPAALEAGVPAQASYKLENCD